VESKNHVIASFKPVLVPTAPSFINFITNDCCDRIYALLLMSSTTLAVKNAAAALKKAADPWNKEGRETADRIVSAAISLVIIWSAIL
jgi:hypothetical protein